MRDRLDAAQHHRHHLNASFFTILGRSHPGWEVLVRLGTHRGTISDLEQDIDHVTLVRSQLFSRVLWSFPLFEINNGTPAEVVIHVLDVYKSSGLHELQRVVGVADDGLHVLCEIRELLSQVIVLADRPFIGNVHAGPLGLQLTKFCALS